MARQTLALQTMHEAGRQRRLDALDTPNPTFTPVTTPAGPAPTADLTVSPMQRVGSATLPGMSNPIERAALMTNTGALAPTSQLTQPAPLSFVPDSPEVAAQRRSLEAGGPVGPGQTPSQPLPAGHIGIAQPNGEYHVILPQQGVNVPPVTMQFANEQTARAHFAQEAAQQAATAKAATAAQTQQAQASAPSATTQARTLHANRDMGILYPTDTPPATNATGTDLRPTPTAGGERDQFTGLLIKPRAPDVFDKIDAAAPRLWNKITDVATGQNKPAVDPQAWRSL